MPTGDDLCGLGMSPGLATVLGNTDNALTCAASGAQAGAAAVKTHNTELVAAGGADSAILPSTAKVGTPYFFYTSSTTSAKVFVPVGHNLAGSANGSVTIAQGKAAIIWQYKLSNWAYVILA